MFLWIAEQLGFPGVLNLFRYITFRAGAATATALLIGLIIGPSFIGWLRVRQGKGQPIRSDGPQTHLAKRGTPTMGGLMILTSLTVSMLLWMDFSNRLIWPVQNCCFPWNGNQPVPRPATAKKDDPSNEWQSAREAPFHPFSIPILDPFRKPCVTIQSCAVTRGRDR